MTRTEHRRTAAVVGVLLAVASALLLAGTAHVAVGTTTGQAWDERAMNTVYAGRDTRLAVLSLLGRVSIGLVVAVMVVCIALALARGRVAWAVGAVTVILGANVTTQVLKRLVVDREDLGLGLGTLNSLPSGHTTVVASAVAATLLVAPPTLRSLLVLAGATATTLTGASTIVAGWHRPADIVAALAVSLLWAAAASAVLSRGRLAGVHGTALMAMIGSAGGLLVLVALGVRPVLGWDGFFDAAGVLGAVAAVTAVFTVLAAAVAFTEPDVSRETDDDSAVGVAGPPLATH